MAVVKPYIPHPPSLKQRLALELNDVEELFWGGAAGGGKSDGDLMLALQYVDVPAYSAAIFRLTKEDLEKPNSILDRATRWWTGTPAHWDGAAHSFRFPSGATIHFGYGQSRKEIEKRYQGPDFQYVGIEELGQWSEEAYRYLFSRLRRTEETKHVPLRMRPNGNPGGVGADWIRLRFVEHARLIGDEGYTVKQLVAARKRGEQLPERPVFVSPPTTEAIDLAKRLGRVAQGAHFLPAYAQDNPGLDVVEYLLQLAKLDTATRHQLEHGDWWASGGGKFFLKEWFKFIEVAPPELLDELRYWDLAATEPKPGKDPDWSAGVRIGKVLYQHGQFSQNPLFEKQPDEADPTAASFKLIIRDATRMRGDPGAVENFVRATAQMDGRRVPVYIEEEPGSAGKNNTHNYASKVLKGHMVFGERKTGPKPEYWKPLASDARNGLLYLVNGPWNEEFVRELCALTDDDSHAHDDQADAAGGGRAKLFDDSPLQLLRNWKR